MQYLGGPDGRRTSRHLRSGAARQLAIVVVADQACSNLWGFRWDPPDLEQLWFVDEEDKFIPSSSPALLADASLALVGREDGEVIAYDPADGDKLWTYEAGEEVLGTPASLIRHVYVASRSHIQALEPATGELVWKRELEGTILPRTCEQVNSYGCSRCI